MISPEDANNSRGGNRFDVPGGGVLYAATVPEGAFAETVSRLRPTASMRKLAQEQQGQYMAPGAVPADWRSRRQLVSFEINSPLPFIDVDAPESHTFLSSELADELEGFDISNLDASDIQGKNRLVTRRIAQYIYTATDDRDNHLYSGIRYKSRLGPWECWAIFEGNEIANTKAQSIARHDDALLAVARILDLTIH